MNIGERVGDYEIVQILGTGGMGQVYKVRNVISDRIEAMKVLLPNMSGDPDLAARFLREIKTQATLDHPNIARLHTALQVGDQLFMMMEFVDGSSIEELLTANGTIRLSDSVNYTSQVLDALSYAHARGVVHRDIKPANIMCTPDGVAKLMDFGIARMQADRHLTKTGHTVGSLYYMSPEQINGGQPDQRSDVYSLGVTFYEMVTGRKPFEGDSDFSIMAAHLQQTPRAPMEIIPGVPPDLSDIILVAIAKDPAARFQSADAFRNALKNIGMPAVAPVATHTAYAVAPAPPPPLPPLPTSRPTRMASDSELAAPVFQAPASASAYVLPPILQAPPSAPYAEPMYSQPQAPPPKPSSKRGLYMAVGSVATVLVLAAGIIEIPKLVGTNAQDNPVHSVPVDVTPVPSRQPEPIVRVPQPGPDNPGPSAASPGSPASRPVQPGPSAGTPTRPVPVTPVQVVPPNRPVAQPNPIAQQPVVVQQPTPAPQPQPAPEPARPDPKLNQLRQEYNQLSIRATTAKDGLHGLQQQMQRQGLNLRADMREAETRMDYQLREAMDSIRNGDAEQASKDLEMARYALESIEKFLGR